MTPNTGYQGSISRLSAVTRLVRAPALLLALERPCGNIFRGLMLALCQRSMLSHRHACIWSLDSDADRTGCVSSELEQRIQWLG